MQKKNGLFVRIQYDLGKGSVSAYGRARNLVPEVSDYKFMFCGGSYKKNEATMVFNARTFSDAEYIVHNNPFIKNENYRFEIFSRNYLPIIS